MGRKLLDLCEIQNEMCECPELNGMILCLFSFDFRRPLLSLHIECSGVSVSLTEWRFLSWWTRRAEKMFASCGRVTS